MITLCPHINNFDINFGLDSGIGQVVSTLRSWTSRKKHHGEHALPMQISKIRQLHLNLHSKHFLSKVYTQLEPFIQQTWNLHKKYLSNTMRKRRLFHSHVGLGNKMASAIPLKETQHEYLFIRRHSSLCGIVWTSQTRSDLQCYSMT